MGLSDATLHERFEKMSFLIINQIECIIDNKINIFVDICQLRYTSHVHFYHHFLLVITILSQKVNKCKSRRNYSQLFVLFNEIIA